MRSRADPPVYNDSLHVRVHRENVNPRRDSILACVFVFFIFQLQGNEDLEGLSSRGQVSRLIREAEDPRNLSRMYKGWAAWW